MKILFLNPHLYDSPLLGTLRGLGVATIVCSDLRECELVFKLHATSISLFVGHDADGVGMNELLKKTSRFARTPVILTTSKWTDQQCIEHQAGPLGANAYLRMPVDDKEFIHVVDQILGTELSHGKGFNLSDDLSAIGPIDLGSAAPLEISSGLDLAIVTDSGGAGDKTTFTPLQIGEPPVPDDPEPRDGITLQTDLGAMGFSPSGGLQIEDAAAVYGAPTPTSANDEPDNPDLVFKLDGPGQDLNLLGSPSGGANDESGNTKEFRIDDALSGDGSGVSEIIATPIEATSIDALSPLAPMVDMGALSDMEQIGDDQPTRVATPILSDSSSNLPSARAKPAPVRSEPVASSNEEVDSESLAAMPYLSRDGTGYPNPLAYREPMDDAVVPGGAATAPDTETLKKYLYLREQDVTALSAQLRQAREQIGLLEGQLKHERAVSSEFAHLAQEQDRRIDGFEREKTVALESAQKEYDDLKFDMKRRTEKIRVMELQVKDATETTERLKERVRNDIRKIRTREKELENRLELMKKDSEALLSSREQKIIELKRKLDLMEFNTDLVQDLLEKERVTALGLREKLAKAAQMMRVAGGLLGPDEEAMLESTGTSEAKSGVNEDDRTTAA
jgi:CheY-like chemotaxis protein